LYTIVGAGREPEKGSPLFAVTPLLSETEDLTAMTPDEVDRTIGAGAIPPAGGNGGAGVSGGGAARGGGGEGVGLGGCGVLGGGGWGCWCGWWGGWRWRGRGGGRGEPVALSPALRGERGRGEGGEGNEAGTGTKVSGRREHQMTGLLQSLRLIEAPEGTTLQG